MGKEWEIFQTTIWVINLLIMVCLGVQLYVWAINFTLLLVCYLIRLWIKR